MAKNYSNPFDRYSSRTKRMNYYVPFLSFGKGVNGDGDNEAFIGREDILYRLRNWILNKEKNGSFLVAGYRGMGKSSFVDKALNNITRQDRRTGFIEFIFLLLHLATVAFFCALYLGRCKTIPILAASLCAVIIICYVWRYYIKYWWGYFLFVCGLIWHVIRNGKWRKEERSGFWNSIGRCISECTGRLAKLGKEERSRLDKIIFDDYRNKQSRRISIKINLGHEILKERDILCLIANRIKSEIDNFISNKHLYFFPAYIYIVICCLCTWGAMEWLGEPVRNAVKTVCQQKEEHSHVSEINIVNDGGGTAGNISKSNTAIVHVDGRGHVGFIGTFFSDLKDFFLKLHEELKSKEDNRAEGMQDSKDSDWGVDDIPWIICFILLYLCIKRLLRLSFSHLPWIKQYIWIIKRLILLNDRIHSIIDEEVNPTAEGRQGIINISLGKRMKKNYPQAGVREIENELIEILSRFDRIPEWFTLKFVIVFDELDKIEPDIKNKEAEDELFATFEGTSNGFSGESGSRKRKDNVLRLLANIKYFISTAHAKFIFISGRELYDAYLAGLSDREFSISSVFSGAIYVDSFLTSNRAQMSVISMTEQYLCKMLLPNDYLRNILVRKYYEHESTTPEYPSLKWYYKYLLSLEGEASPGDEQEWKLKGGIIFLHYYAIYLAHLGNGSPQKILAYFRLYVKTQDNLYRKGNKSPYIYGWANANKKRNPKKNYILTFNYTDQREIAFIFYMAYPTMQAIINNATQYGDKILISASFLMNHIYKYHTHSFSWRNLEQAPELLEVYRTPELRAFINTILSYMVQTHMTNIPSGLYNFKFRISVSNEIAIFSKFSEEIAAIFNFTLDESLSVKKHYTRMLAHYSDMLNRTNSNQEHYAILLSRIHQVLGDLQMTDENYMDSALEYRNSIVYLKDLLYQKEKSQQMASGDIILPIIRNMLKLGLSYERRKTNNSAYVIYYELICMLIDFRYVDEAELGLELRVDKSRDWRDKKYVLYREEQGRIEKREARRNFEKEIDTQLLRQKENPDSGTRLDYEIQGDELVTGLSRILTPEKSNLIFRLSILEDLRLVYQAILAKLFVLEKGELGGITKANVDVAESEFRYLYRVTNAKDKFIILVDFFRRLAEILYYKNGFINRRPERFVTGLYFWGYEFNTDVEEYCRANNIGTKIQNMIIRIIDDIKWNDLDDGILNWKEMNHNSQWEKIKAMLNPVIDTMTSEGELKACKEAALGFINNWDTEKSYVKNLSYFKIDECNRHREEMRRKGYYVPCFACRYYNRSMHILAEYFFGEKDDIEDKISKVRAFLRNAAWASYTYSLRPNYLQTIAIVLDGMGNIQLSCSDKDAELTTEFLEQLSKLSDDNKEFESMMELTSLEKAVLYYWAAARYYKKGSYLKDASLCMTKILHLLQRYIMVEAAMPTLSENRILMLSEYICPIIDIVARKSILYLYAHNENISIAEIQDLKDLFSKKIYENISLEKLSLYPDIEEVVMLSIELKMNCYKAFGYKPELMPMDFRKDESLNVLRFYSSRLSSPYNIANSVHQLIVESRMKALMNYRYLDFMFNGIELMEFYIEDGNMKLRYKPDSSVAFYGQFAGFLRSELKAESLKIFGMNMEECGITGECLSVKDKLYLVEFLLKDSMFCLQRILSVLTTNTNQLMYTNSYIAEVYRMMFTWSQLFKFIYFAYEYMGATDEGRENILNSLNASIVACYKSMEQELNQMDVKKSRKDIKQALELCVSEIPADLRLSDDKSLGRSLYDNILFAIAPTNRRYIISNYPAEMAMMYYRKAIEMHTEGNAYKEMISGLYYLDDDLQNDTEQFNMALERYMINCGYIDCISKAMKNIFSKSFIYDIRCYEGNA